MKRIRRAPSGHKVGESHHRAKYRDADIELLRQLYNPAEGRGYGFCARKLEMPKSTVQAFIKGYRREY